MIPAESYRPSGDPEGCRVLGMIRTCGQRCKGHRLEAVSSEETKGSFGRYSCSGPLSCRRSTKRISAPLPLIESRLADVGRMANEVVSIQARSPLAVTCADEVGCIFSEGGAFYGVGVLSGKGPTFPALVSSAFVWSSDAAPMERTLRVEMARPGKHCASRASITAVFRKGCSRLGTGKGIKLSF